LKPRQIGERVRANFIANPLVWILCAALALAEYGNYQRGKELDLLCDLTGPHDMYYGKPVTNRQRADNTCIARQSDDSESRDVHQ